MMAHSEKCPDFWTQDEEKGCLGVQKNGEGIHGFQKSIKHLNGCHMVRWAKMGITPGHLEITVAGQLCDMEDAGTLLSQS
jgi:hypothetical protein